MFVWLFTQFVETVQDSRLDFFQDGPTLTQAGFCH